MKLDTTGLDVYESHRSWQVGDHTIHVTLYSTRWRWDLYGPNGLHLTGDEPSPGRAAHFALHALEQLVTA